MNDYQNDQRSNIIIRLCEFYHSLNHVSSYQICRELYKLDWNKEQNELIIFQGNHILASKKGEKTFLSKEIEHIYQFPFFLLHLPKN